MVLCINGSRRICKCELGNAGLGVGDGFLEEVVRVEEFLKDPWVVRAGRGGGDGRDVGIVQVLVPKVVAAPPLPVPVAAEDGGEDGAVGATSVLARRAAMQRQAVAASMAAEDYVRRLEAGGAAVRVLFDLCWIFVFLGPLVVGLFLKLLFFFGSV